ncbi:putative squalene synthase [Alternaria arborescens]|uniref:putative squalene synthase n=1 Tax=Alternaria arborescens TaxID=156630 RepID=UPI001074DD5B|nr:putative squalene synthase [Alternaria arborescens]RYO23858.1 putative squalene synthase [Alternaria arborescens]
MPSPLSMLYYVVHPNELRSIIQWKVWHNAVHERDESKECESLKRCFHFLNKTSRSFAAVILELHPELLVPVTLFYLVLRGLDTIEDDMTIPLEKKEPLLRNFQDILDKDGWNFTENGPNEKDRQLLVEFNVVIEEFKKIKPVYQDIIKDITKRMGNGMADYANNAEFNAGVKTIKEYELYCHYVAGLVGEGCTRLFVEAGLANAALLKRPELMESMGQFLQQVNITRDIKEDIDDGRRFWPKEIWSKHVDEFEDLFKPENKQKALNCSSEMILTALTRADDCLYYLAGLREQSVFNFCAIPQTMAIATLETCFQNYALFRKNVKITKGEACQLMVESTQNLQLVCEVFRRYARKIAKKNNPHDPNFLKISITLGRIEQFIESIFPTQQPPVDKKAPATIEEAERKRKEDSEANWDLVYIVAAVVGTVLVITFIMLFVAWLAGARFDIAYTQFKLEFGKLMGVMGLDKTPEVVTEVHETLNKSEL